jgi:predicted Co/Zn/Cd cation transporter (cation efflux family)
MLLVEFAISHQLKDTAFTHIVPFALHIPAENDCVWFVLFITLNVMLVTIIHCCNDITCQTICGTPHPVIGAATHEFIFARG